MSTPEKRRQPRIPHRDAAFIFVEVPTATGPTDRKVYGCATADISTGGVQITLPARLEPGIRVDLRIAALTPPTSFRLQGKVAWVREGRPSGSWQVGIEIIPGDDKYSLAWQEYIQAAQADAAKPTIFRMRVRPTSTPA